MNKERAREIACFVKLEIALFEECEMERSGWIQRSPTYPKDSRAMAAWGVTLALWTWGPA